MKPLYEETLRFVGEGVNGRTQTECIRQLGAPWEQPAHWYARLERLRISGHLRRRGSRFHLTAKGIGASACPASSPSNPRAPEGRDA